MSRETTTKFGKLVAGSLWQCRCGGLRQARGLRCGDANALCAGHDFRRAVLDAGLAGELAVTRLITAHLTAAGETAADTDTVLRENSMLRRRCRYWVRDCGGTLPSNQSRLITGATPLLTPGGYSRNPMCATQSPSHVRSSIKRFRSCPRPKGSGLHGRSCLMHCIKPHGNHPARLRHF
jgi:hypothetical protein